ncbi:MAG: GGDEF domain-containing protein [Nitrospira sp.]|nr:GGDEF domain-containing protein [Nitrospira sp.]
MASEELPPANLQRTPDPQLLPTNQRLESLHQLLAAVAACQDEHDILKTLTRRLPELIPADAIGIARSRCEHVRLWSSDQSRETEARLRRYLLRRLGLVAPDTPQPARPRRSGRSRHLSLVPRSGCTFLEPDERPTNAHEISLALGQEEGGLFLVKRNGHEAFSEWERQALHIVGTVLAVSFRNAESRRFQQDLDRCDSLTAILNSHAFDGALTRELRVGQRYGITACLLVIGLDYFRTVNDRLGHEAGDHVLRSAAAVIREMVRDTDIVGRCGGDTFGVVLPHTERRQACHLAERLRERIERHLFISRSGQVRITASMGVAVAPDLDVATSSDWATIAGSALKEAKAQGRNCVAIHVPQPPALACAVALSLAA